MAKSSTRRVTIYINGKEAYASGWQTFSYGKLGEVTENIRTFARASHTQTQTNPQPNMHLTHNPSSITRNLAEKHTFSSKERDTETGLSYFGARYYSSDLSIWLSVDPMADKYPSLSPYTYCANNPVKLVDPNGEEIRIHYGNGNKYIRYTPGMKVKKRYDSFVKDAINGLNFLYDNPQGDNNRVAYTATKTNEIIDLHQGKPGETSTYNCEERSLHWDNQSIDVFEGGSQSPIVTLAHELDHADRSTKAWDAYYECVANNPGTGDSPCDIYIEQARGADVDAAESSAVDYENYIGGLLYDGKSISSYRRQSHRESPIRQIKASSIFSHEE